MFTRYASAISTGSIMTFGLLFIMQTLIAMQPGVIIEHPPTVPVIYKKIREEEPVKPRRVELPKREQLTKTSTPPARPTVSDNPISVHVRTPTPTTPGPMSTVSFSAFNDGPLANIIRVKPLYPPRATSKGLEGYVIVEFDVDRQGLVHNVRIVESTNSIFERNSIRAAERFKFKPRIVDGVPQAVTGVRNLFRFELEKE